MVGLPELECIIILYCEIAIALAFVATYVRHVFNVAQLITLLLVRLGLPLHHIHFNCTMFKCFDIMIHVLEVVFP